MDHGTLNLPLAKRGEINKQLDAYKRQQRAGEAIAHRAAVVQFQADKAAAKVALAQIVATPSLIEAKAARMCVSRNRLLSMLHDWSKWEPKKLISLHAQWVTA